MSYGINEKGSDIKIEQKVIKPIRIEVGLQSFEQKSTGQYGVNSLRQRANVGQKKDAINFKDGEETDGLALQKFKT